MQKFALLFICSLACSVVCGQTFTLDISKGYGTGTYQKGDTVFIWSSPEVDTRCFDHWQGSAKEYMLEGNEWLTRIVVPTNDTISLVHASASLNDLSSTVLIGDEEIILPGMDYGIPELTPKGVYYQIPDNPIGIIFCFHGTGGSGVGFETDFEKRSFFKAGANRNYLMIATEANEKTHGDQDGNGKLRWHIKNELTDNSSNNIDIKLIKALRDTFINRYNLPDDFPTFSLGVSNGANFADLCAAALNFNASGHMTGNGLTGIYENRADATPVIFVQSINDQHESAKPDTAFGNHEALLERGISSEFYWHTKTPVYNERFIRTTDLLISKEISDSIFQRMKRHPNLLDSINRILISNNSELPENLFDGLNLSNGSQTDCENQIKIMNADHKFHSHFNNRIFDFFDLHLEQVNSIEKHTKESPITLYPNPTQSNFHVTNVGMNASISVLSSSGQLIYKVVGISEIDMTPFPDGVYFIKVVDSEQTTVKIIVKER